MTPKTLTPPTPRALPANLVQKLDAAVRTIVERFTPERIILFGSYAWGTPTVDSDVDLFIVKATDNPLELTRQVDQALWDRDFPLDILVYRPATIRRLRAEGHTFLDDVMTNGRVLYDRSTTRS